MSGLCDCNNCITECTEKPNCQIHARITRRDNGDTIQLSRAEYEALQDELNLWKVRCQFMCSNYFRVASLDMGGRHTYTAIGRTVGRGYSFYEALDARKAAIDAAINMTDGEGEE